MRTTSIRSRPDQIAELTRGLQLPLAEIEWTHIEVLAECLFNAFEAIRKQWPETVTSGSEAEVTALLESRLSRLLEEDPLWSQLVHCVVRGKETLSYDGAHLEKRPDLSIYLSNRTRGFPLVVEAKILDAATARTEALYCDHGLLRFLDGKYAWACQEAFMIAYVRDSSSIGETLKPFLVKSMSRVPPPYAVEQLPVRHRNTSPDFACSKHSRSFVYPNQSTPQNLPGPITVWHLWLK